MRIIKHTASLVIFLVASSSSFSQTEYRGITESILEKHESLKQQYSNVLIKNTYKIKNFASIEGEVPKPDHGLYTFVLSKGSVLRYMKGSAYPDLNVIYYKSGGVQHMISGAYWDHSIDRVKWDNSVSDTYTSAPIGLAPSLLECSIKIGDQWVSDLLKYSKLQGVKQDNNAVLVDLKGTSYRYKLFFDTSSPL